MSVTVTVVLSVTSSLRLPEKGEAAMTKTLAVRKDRYAHVALDFFGRLNVEIRRGAFLWTSVAVASLVVAEPT